MNPNFNLPPGTLARDIDDKPTKDCPECGGRGFVMTYDDDEKPVSVECDECEGDGQVPV